MKPVKKIISTLSAAAFLTGLAINFNACSEQSPLVLKLNSPKSLNKLVNVSQMVTVQNGGNLGAGTILGLTGLNEFKDAAPVVATTELAFAHVSLSILPGAVSEDAEISLSLESTELLGGVAVTFEPHGVTFSSPAILNIEAHGVDFSGVDPDSVDVYYDNPETGQWELMQRDDVIVDANAGTIQVINAQLPHFSRYAIGAE